MKGVPIHVEILEFYPIRPRCGGHVPRPPDPGADLSPSVVRYRVRSRRGDPEPLPAFSLVRPGSEVISS